MGLDIKMPFGKHKGLYLEEIPVSYLKWLVDGKIVKPGALNEAINNLYFQRVGELRAYKKAEDADIKTTTWSNDPY